MFHRAFQLLAFLLPFAALAATEPAPRLYLIGDSTMADKPLDLPERGWGQALPQFFIDPAMVHNHAVNGRSSKSFIDEGRWQKVLDELTPGDFVIIQFGHNDEKSEDPKRYTDPATSYPDNLRRFVREARAKQAFPILATSVSRRKFDAQGRLVDTHGAYPAATRQVARELDVPLLDLQPATAKMIEQAGVEGSKKFFMWIPPGQYEKLPKGSQDDTHFVELGATRVAALAVEQIRAARLPLARWLK
jgi:DNA sulfur modification protein DndE